MSEQQSQTAATTTANQNEPETSEPAAERQAELRAAYNANLAAGKPPHEKVVIRTLGELRWILREHDWSGEFINLERKQRPDLRGAATMYNANLSGADLSGADLSSTDLSGADLSDTNLIGATLRGVHLAGANLSRATIIDADMRGADLGIADLREANLSDTNLSGADLSGARMDAATTLDGVTLDGNTHLGDVRWNGAQLTQVPAWPLPLGDEQAIAEAQSRRRAIAAYRNAARAYRGLSIALRGQGLLIPASNYRLREQVLERKAMLLEFSLLGWVFSWLLYLVAGYGERPVRSFFAYLLVIAGFTTAYLALGPGEGHVFSIQGALVFSLTSFHGRGFFPGTLSLDDFVTLLAAIEAVIGLFIEITFIATFTQRFFGGR